LAWLVTGISNPFWIIVARGVEDVAREQDMNVFLCHTDESESEPNTYPSLVCKNKPMVSCWYWSIIGVK
jgi:DNA-binding LacI/PurR family transcriptional regulator